MANNRCYLVQKDNLKNMILLAKYYPDTGWCLYHSEGELTEWLDSFSDKSPYGLTNFTIRFETNNFDDEPEV
jgi:hypothetical protein